MTVEETSKKSKNAKATTKESSDKAVRIGTIENWRKGESKEKSKEKPKKPQKSPLRGG